MSKNLIQNDDSPVHEQMDEQSAIVKRLSAGEEVELVGSSVVQGRIWCEIETSEGVRGFVTDTTRMRPANLLGFYISMVVIATAIGGGVFFVASGFLPEAAIFGAVILGALATVLCWGRNGGIVGVTIGPLVGAVVGALLGAQHNGLKGAFETGIASAFCGALFGAIAGGVGGCVTQLLEHLGVARPAGRLVGAIAGAVFGLATAIGIAMLIDFELTGHFTTAFGITFAAAGLLGGFFSHDETQTKDESRSSDDGTQP